AGEPRTPDVCRLGRNDCGNTSFRRRGIFPIVTKLALETDKVAEWRTGLAALPDAHTARNVILTDEQVLALIAAAYGENGAVGVLVEGAAITGEGVPQLARLEVADLKADRGDPRLMMPSSRKGKGVKRITRKPVPITADLAAKLTRAVGNRAPSEPL